MKVFFSKKAEKGIEQIYQHVIDNFSKAQAKAVRDELVKSILKLAEFPELGLRIAGQAEKRVLVVAGNLIIYEIVLRADPVIVIRNIRPRGKLF